MARPERFELPTTWFVVSVTNRNQLFYINLKAASPVAFCRTVQDCAGLCRTDFGKSSAKFLITTDKHANSFENVHRAVRLLDRRFRAQCAPSSHCSNSATWYYS